MSQQFPGRKVSKEYLPRNLRLALAATRMANAYESSMNGPKFRYIIDSPIHEAVDPGNIIRIVDAQEGNSLIVSELLQRLPEDLRKRVLIA